jgi:DNA-directed RNA polymerase subunit RPC12/RpoP
LADDVKRGGKMTKTEAGKGGRVGEVRCSNCFERFWPMPGTERATCPGCGWEWYISWRGKLAKIRKPVWESWERQQADTKRTNG